MASKTHVQACLSAWAEILFQLHGIFSDFSAQAESRPGLNPLHVIDNFDFKWSYVKRRIIWLRQIYSTDMNFSTETKLSRQIILLRRII